MERLTLNVSQENLWKHQSVSHVGISQLGIHHPQLETILYHSYGWSMFFPWKNHGDSSMKRWKKTMEKPLTPP